MRQRIAAFGTSNPTELGVRQFISPYLTPSDADYIAKNHPELHYFSYDWNLNGTCTAMYMLAM